MSALRAEARKAASIRSTTWVAIGAIGVTVLGAITTVSSSAASELMGPLHDQAFYAVGAVNLSVVSLVVGARSMTDEFRHGTIVWTFLASSSRPRVLAAKAFISAVVAAITAVLSITAAGSVAFVLANAKDAGVELTTTDIAHALRLAGAAAAWATIGCAVGAITRHATGTTVAVVVWMLVVENVLAVPLGPVANVLPGQAGLVAAGAAGSSVPAPIGGLILIVWTLALSLIGRRSLVRRPVMVER